MTKPKLDELTVTHLQEAAEICGYDFDLMMSTRTNRREYADFRSIIWKLCADETGAKPMEIGRRFGWERSTVACAIMKADELVEYDRVFRDIYDAIYGYYMDRESNAENQTKD